MMNKRHLSAFLILAFLLTIIPMNVFAGASITIDTIQNAHPGDLVTISGTTAFSEVNISVFYPNEAVLSYDQIKITGGRYSKSLRMPADAPVGTYTVTVREGSSLEKGSFTITSKTAQSGGDGTSSDGSPAANPQNGQPTADGQGTVKLSQTPSLDKATGIAKASVTADDLDRAFSTAKADENGITHVVLEVKAVEGAGSYEQELPAQALASGGAGRRIEIRTPVASITVPGNMLSAGSVPAQSKIALNVSPVDKSALSEEAKKLVGNRPVIELSMKVDGKQTAWENPDAPVRISMDYTPTAEELKDPEHICIVYIDGAGKLTVVPDGRYDPSTGKVTFTTTHFSKYAVALIYKTFSDLGGYPWAKKQIEVLASKGIINGTTATTYSPGAKITRGDFISLLVRTLNLNAKFEQNFDDVSKGSSCYNAVGIAKKLGITTGTGGGKFAPKAPISRQDMMVMVAKALKVSRNMKIDGTAADLAGYTDAADITGSAVGSVATLVKKGIVSGNAHKINPKGGTTRAETAVIMYRLTQQ
jgi:hypothetical protein